MKPVSVLLVCMGNICRSPTAEAVLRQRVERAGWQDRVFIDSAGTHDYHVGEAPDRRAIAHARERGYDLSGLRARQVTRDDITRFDWILAMDQDNLQALHRLQRGTPHPRMRRYLEFAPEAGLLDVPDPYYGGADGFHRVIDLVEQAADGWLAHLDLQSCAAPQAGAPESRSGRTDTHPRRLHE